MSGHSPVVLAALASLLFSGAVLVWPPRQRIGADARHRAGPSEAPDLADGPAPVAAADQPGWAAVATYESVAGALGLLAVSLRGGAGMTESIAAVARRIGGEAGNQLDTVVAGLRWGLDDAEAWEGAPRVWQRAARALRMAAISGMPPADLLEATARDLRREHSAALRVATARLGVRIVLPLGLAFLPAFALTTVIPVLLALAGRVLGQSW